jgi:hypothetical protein
VQIQHVQVLQPRQESQAASHTRRIPVVRAACLMRPAAPVTIVIDPRVKERNIGCPHRPLTDTICVSAECGLKRYIDSFKVGHAMLNWTGKTVAGVMFLLAATIAQGQWTTPSRIGGYDAYTPRSGITRTTPNWTGGYNVYFPSAGITTIVPNGIGYNVYCPGVYQRSINSNGIGGCNSFGTGGMSTTGPSGTGGYSTYRRGR